MSLLILIAAAFATPTPSVARGVYDDPFSLELAPSTADATITYSIDRSTPSLPYTGPLEITGTTILRAREIYADGTISDTVTHTYLFPADVAADPLMDTRITLDATYGPELDSSLRTLPSILVTTASAITTTEQAASFEWIDPDGDDSQIDCGVEETGGTSDAYAKSSVRLHFRSEYGPSTWEFDVYGDDYTGVPPADEFNSISLRSGNHDTTFYLGASGQYLRNLWMDETQLEMGHIAPHGRFAHLYLNGIYAGLYHVRERFDTNMMAEYLGGEEGDYEAINGGTAFDGSGAAWSALVANADDWEVAREWLNVENYLDYMVLQYYAANAWDWSSTHNWMSAGPVEAGEGGFLFHSSDSDICLYYGYTTNILALGGPSNVFTSLRTEAHPDFLVALSDAVFRNLRPGGPLDAEVAAARYQRLADSVEPHLAPEAARWGFGWWDPDDEWVTERDRLLNEFYPYRTDELRRQFRAAGLYPLDGPEFSLEQGAVASGTVLDVSVPDDATGELWLTTDGQDPRVSGGDLYAGAVGPAAVTSLTLDRSVVVKARLRDGDDWGPLGEGFYEIDAPPRLALNEWNAVADDGYLDEGGADGDGQDSALGRLLGNGGDWIELLVLEDETDLRGWRLTMADRRGERGELVFTDDPVLSDLRAGTILTIAEDLPEDVRYDPDNGDWRFHLRAGASGTGVTISATPFDVTHLEWTLTIWDADGAVAFGPVGESVSPRDGISAGEVGLLRGTPTDALRRTSEDYGASRQSTYGSPNVWDGGEQDLRALRGQTGGVSEIEDSAQPVDTGPVWDSVPDAEETGNNHDSTGNADTGAKGATGCGCGHGDGGGGLAALGLSGLLLARRRRRWIAPVLLVACTESKVTPLDTGSTDATDDSGTTEDSAPPDESAPAPTLCYEDDDLDGYGDPEDATEDCSGSNTSDATDCDDDDTYVHPGAPEVCNGVDDDCDTWVDDADDDLADPLPFYADADGDGYGSDGALTYACSYGAGLALAGGDCDDADATVSPGAAELCDDIDQDCDGTSSDSLGSSEECTATSCLEILEHGGDVVDGAYWIELPDGEVTALWCDMSTDGGGWTLGFLRNTASTGSQGDFGSGYQGLESLATAPEDASTSATSALSWIDLNAFDWSDLRLSSFYSGSETYTSANIPRTELRISFGENGYFLYGGATGYYWCGGDASYTDAGVGATDNPAGAPSDCKYHGSLGSGWDFSQSNSVNAGLTLCGGDGSYFLSATWAGTYAYYGSPGGAYAIWVR